MTEPESRLLRTLIVWVAMVIVALIVACNEDSRRKHILEMAHPVLWRKQ